MSKKNECKFYVDNGDDGFEWDSEPDDGDDDWDDDDDN
jgi:hypothetical protein